MMSRQNLSEISMMALAMVDGDTENGSMMKKTYVHDGRWFDVHAEPER